MKTPIINTFVVLSFFTFFIGLTGFQRPYELYPGPEDTLAAEEFSGGSTASRIERYFTGQLAELRGALVNAQIRLEDNKIVIVFCSDTFFSGQTGTALSDQEVNLIRLAGSLVKYEHSEVSVSAHTDSMGAGTHNQQISEERANAVSSVLIHAGVDGSRIFATGYGEEKPIADNLTEENRKKNRRVEIIISPSKKMVKLAEKGKLNV